MTSLLLAGGGLANSLIAWRLASVRPDIRLTLLEREATLGGNHTWSFHGTDLTPAQFDWLQPLVAHSWSGQLVRFPRFERRLDTSYHSVTSQRLHTAVSARLGAALHIGMAIADVQPREVKLASGETLQADIVLDGRGAPPMPGFALAWQKFLGLEVRTDLPHGVTTPVLMDATVTQLDGYRFLYVLPLDEHRLLIEDTCYSDTPEIEPGELRTRVHSYAAAQGWRVAAVLREETGSLPIVLDGDPDDWWRQAGGGAPRTGMRALLFHHTTGYSLPEAVRLADVLAAEPDLGVERVAALVQARSLQRWREQRMFRLLNRLMFEAARPDERYRTLQHFYRLPEPLIRRFYAGQLRGLDAPRLLLGRPPVPVTRALACIARGLLPHRVPVGLASKGHV